MAKYADGCIVEIKKGRKYKVRLSLGFDPVSKKYRRMTRTVNGTLADAKQLRDELLKAYKDGYKVDADKLTFGEFSQDWFLERKASGNVARSTLDKDRHNLATLNRYLGSVPLKGITSEVASKVLTKIKLDKLDERGSFSNTTMNMIYRLLSQILQSAVKKKYLSENPCDTIDNKPKPDDSDREGLCEEDASSLISFVDSFEAECMASYAAKEDRQTEHGKLFGRQAIYGLGDLGRLQAVRIALLTGLRRGEIFALTWEQIDLDTKTLHVRYSLDSDGNLKPPKSKMGKRDVHFNAYLADSLRSWKAYQKHELHKLGITVGKGTPVCCSNTGGFSDLRYFERWWTGFRKEAGFPLLRFHELRHTHATLLASHGTDPKTLQLRMGHYSAALTLNWYCHGDPERDAQAGDRIGDILKPNETPILAAFSACAFSA